MIRKYIGHLFRYRHHQIGLKPVHQIKVDGNLYESTGNDSQFELTSNRQRLPRRWVFISYQREDIDGIFSPVLYFDKGQGYCKDNKLFLPSCSVLKSELIRLPYNVQALRFDPGVQSGHFRLSNFKLTETGFIPLLFILSWRELAGDNGGLPRKITNVFKGIGYLCFKGPVSARDRLTARHKRRYPPWIFTGYKTAPAPEAPAWEEWQALIDAHGVAVRGDNFPVTDVIIPVFRGYNETLSCIYHVLNSVNNSTYNLVVINDASPDRLLSQKLCELAESGLFELRQNRKNLGFVKTANIGMRLHEDRDVVLLNADTQVFSDWLDRMRAAAYASSKVGTVTPLSNNAEICSYPYVVQDNNMQLEVPWHELDAIAAQVNTGKTVQIPTGVGFCMYLRRDCLVETGFLDEEVFSKGYGEENDLCLRAAAAGWQHVLATYVFVRHVGGSSFGVEKQARVDNAIRIINQTYPGYNQRIQEFLRSDPVSEYRKNIDVARLRRAAKRKVFLFVSHNWGGGTEKHIQDMARHLRNEGVDILYMRPDPDNKMIAIFSSPLIGFLPNIPVIDLSGNNDMSAMILLDLGVTHVHIHNLAGFNEKILTALPEIMQAAGIRYDLTLHDYTMICPRMHLSDDKGRYCGEPQDKACNTCISKYGSPFGNVEIKGWKMRCYAILHGARMVYVPNGDVKERMRRYYQDIVYTLRPHPELGEIGSRCVSSYRKQGEPIRVGIIGAIGPHKGSYLLQRCARDARDRHLPLEFVVLGYTNIIGLANEPNVSITGEYEEEEIYDLIREQRVHVAFFPATWPETYSYTLSVVLKAGLRPIAFDFGAIADRMKKLGCEELLIPFSERNSPGKINDFLLRSCETYPEVNKSYCKFMEYGTLTKDYYLFV